MMRYPVDQWERASLASLDRSRKRRGELPRGLMPHGTEWLVVLAVTVFFAFLISLYIVLWAIL